MVSRRLSLVGDPGHEQADPALVRSVATRLPVALRAIVRSVRCGASACGHEDRPAAFERSARLAPNAPYPEPLFKMIPVDPTLDALVGERVEHGRPTR